MRFDKIDLIGNFKIKGLTGTPGQAIGLSGSEFGWVDAQGSTIDALNLVGTNYVICQSGTNSFLNGDLFLSAYATASSIAITTMQRTTVLVTPGLYNFNQDIILDTTMVDLVGFTNNPSDITLQGSGTYLFNINASIDTGLSNMTLDLGSNNFGIYDQVGGSYLRWNNLVIKNGSIFTDESGSSTDIIGEFDNIEIIDCANAFYVLSGDINGTFKNIRIKNTPKFFINDSGNIYGTFSNIELSGTSLSYGFYANNNFHAYLDDFISLSDIQYDLFGAGGVLSGHFKNIKAKNLGNAIFFTNSGDIDIEIQNVIVNSCGGFLVSAAEIDGDYNNIEISECIGEAISSMIGDILGNYRNIKIGNISNYFVHTLSGNIQANFTDIELGDVNQSCFVSNGGSILSTVNNFKSEIVTDSAFFSENNFFGTFSNIFIEKVGEYFIYCYNQSLYGTYLNISVNSLNDSFFATQSIDGEFRNITIGSASGYTFLVNSDILGGVYNNVKIGDVNNNVFCSSYGTISGTFSNIEVGDIANGYSFMYSMNEISGYYKDITVGNLQTGLGSNFGDCKGYFENISFGNNTNSIFIGNNIYGTFRNIKGGNCNLVFNSTYETDCIAENVQFESVSYLFLSINGGVNGTFSDFRIIGGNTIDAFSPGSLYLSGSFKDFYLGGTVSSFMNAGSFILPTTIDNLNINGYLSAHFQGTIRNSRVDARGLGNPAIILDHTTYPTIERCKFLSDAGLVSISSNSGGRCYISYTLTNQGITSSIINEVSGETFNIDNTYIN